MNEELLSVEDSTQKTGRIGGMEIHPAPFTLSQAFVLSLISIFAIFFPSYTQRLIDRGERIVRKLP